MTPDNDRPLFEALDPATVERNQAVLRQVAGLRRTVSDLTGALSAARTELHTGQDDAGAVTARVDGTGRVVDVTLQRPSARLDSRALSAAVLAALADAEQHRTDALQALATTLTAQARAR